MDALFHPSQVFWIAVQPLSAAFLFVMLAVAACVFARRGLAALAGSIAGAILFVTLYTNAGTMALQTLEQRVARPIEEPRAVSCLIVLGGAGENRVNRVRGGFEFNHAGDRFIEALRLAQANPQARILISGGDGYSSEGFGGDAALAQRFFGAFGIGTDRLIREGVSRNTFENSRATAQLLKSSGLEGCLLITSAYHMPRSLSLFRAAGVDVLPWPSDYRTSGSERPGFDFSNPIRNAFIATTAAREWTSLAAQSLLGRLGGVSD